MVSLYSLLFVRLWNNLSPMIYNDIPLLLGLLLIISMQFVVRDVHLLTFVARVVVNFSCTIYCPCCNCRFVFIWLWLNCCLSQCWGSQCGCYWFFSVELIVTGYLTSRIILRITVTNISIAVVALHCSTSIIVTVLRQNFTPP